MGLGFAIRIWHKPNKVVIPAKAGIQLSRLRQKEKLGPGLRRDDGVRIGQATGGSDARSHRGRTQIAGVSTCPA
jgi:hypothetical protein